MRGPMLHGIMTQFLRQVDWGNLDYLVIDLPPGTGDVPLTLAQALPLTGAVVVCTPQEVALLDATRAITMFRQLKVPLLGMIENMSFFDVVAYLRDRGGPEAQRQIDGRGYFDVPGDERIYIFGRGGARRKAEQLGVPFLGEVPLNIFLRETRRRRQDRDGTSSRLAGPALSAGRRRAARRPDQHPEHQGRRPRCRSSRSSASRQSPPPQSAARGRAGRLTILEHEGAVDQHMVNAFGRRAAGGVC